MARRSKTDRRARYVALRDGVRKHFAGHAEVVVAGARHSPEAIAARAQALIDGIDRTHVAHVAWKAALAQERRLEQQARRFLRALDEVIAGMFGSDSAATREMGVSRRKTGPKTLASKVQGIRKSAETRRSRRQR